MFVCVHVNRVREEGGVGGDNEVEEEQKKNEGAVVKSVD